MRQHYLDNIRSLGILLLFPYHTFCIYCSFQSFYVHSGPVRFADDFILVTYAWFMPLLFLVAGMSSHLALKKRTGRQYLKERVLRLFLPFFFGILLVVPAQTYFAERFHNNYTGSYLAQYILYFTKPTNLTGFAGGFTPAHLWFLLYLVIISFLALPLTKMATGRENTILAKVHHPFLLLSLFLFPLILTPLANVGGKSLGQFLAFFLLGYFMSAREGLLEMIEQHRRSYLYISLACAAVFYVVFYSREWVFDYSPLGILFAVFRLFIGWTTILAILGYARRFLNTSTAFSRYVAQAAFPVYVFHQSILIAIAFYAVRLVDSVPLQMLLIMSLSLVGSIIAYLLSKLSPITRFMFGIKG